MTLSLSNHLAADSAAQALRRDVRRRPDRRRRSRCRPSGSTTRGQRPVRPDHPAAGVLPDTGGGGDPRATARARSPPRPAPTRWSSSAAARRRRPGCCSSALRDAGSLRRFVPFDVDAAVLQAAERGHPRRVPGHRDRRRVRRFRGAPRQDPPRRPSARGVPRLHDRQPRRPGRAPTSSPTLSDTLRPGDTLLLGTDLVKDTDRLVRAYDDSAGVTAQFNRNVLAVVNRELDADFDLDAFEHVARWNADEERIEMWLRARSAQRVRVAALDLTVEFAAGEEMLTEVSCKFRPRGRGATELAAAGLRRTHWWTDRGGRLRAVAFHQMTDTRGPVAGGAAEGRGAAPGQRRLLAPEFRGHRRRRRARPPRGRGGRLRRRGGRLARRSTRAAARSPP